jgi:hypothetical protein
MKQVAVPIDTMYRCPEIKFTPKLKPESVFSGAWSKSWFVKNLKKDSAYLDQQVPLHPLLVLYSSIFHPTIRQSG